jgi:hypothetical protein
MKKAQTEIIGLMVIVILFIIIGTVFIAFTFRRSPENIEIRQSTKVTNLMNAIMKYTPCETDPKKESIEGIIRICDDNDYCSMPCKTYLEKEIKSILEKSLDGTQKFRFIVNKNKAVFLEIQGDKPCEGDLISDSFISYAFNAKLELCN